MGWGPQEPAREVRSRVPVKMSVEGRVKVGSVGEGGAVERAWAMASGGAGAPIGACGACVAAAVVVSVTEGRPAEVEGRAAGSSAAAVVHEVGAADSATVAGLSEEEENHALAIEEDANPRCWR